MSRLAAVAAFASFAALGAVLAAPAGGVSGGREVGIARAPFVAKVGGCTATLVAPDRVLTAAHCVAGFNPTGLLVYVGVDPVKNRKAPGVAALGFSVHPGYKLSFPFAKKSPINAIAVDDVALVMLAEPVTRVAPVRVAGRSDAALERPGRTARLLGYGLLQAPSRTAPPRRARLHEGAVTVLSRAGCARAYPKAVTREMICHEDPDGRKPYTEACGGDSGGPLVVHGPRGPVQIGITSWGAEVKDAGCGERDLPSVTMRVAAYGDWISQRDPTIAPYPTLGPIVTGEPRAGATLTCAATMGGSPARLAYRWVTTKFKGQLSDENADRLIKPIPGATSSTLLVTPQLAGRKVACEVIARNRGGHYRTFSINLQLAASRSAVVAKRPPDRERVAG